MRKSRFHNVGHTCPDIDQAISDSKNIIDILESLRSKNQELREACAEAEQELGDAEKRINELERECGKLENRVAELEKELDVRGEIGA